MTDRLTAAEARLIAACDIYARLHPRVSEGDDSAADLYGALDDVRTERMRSAL